MTETARVFGVWLLRAIAAWSLILLASSLATAVQLLWVVPDRAGWDLFAGWLRGNALYLAIAVGSLTVSEIALSKKRMMSR